MKKSFRLLLLLLFLSLACGFAWPLGPATPGASATPSIAATIAQAPIDTPLATISPTAKQVLVRYENARYGYAISYPSSFVVNAISDEYVELGDKIIISVNAWDPESFVGDGPVVESVTSEVMAGQPVRVLRGYIGAIGGYIPQQFISYVFQHNDLYYTFTQYALGLQVASGDVSQIAMLSEEDLAVFRSIMETLSLR